MRVPGITRAGHEMPAAWRPLLALGAVVLSQLPWVPPTIFGGVDEWMMLEVSARGILSVPYAHRPLGLLWALPPALLSGSLGFLAFRLSYAIYLLASATLLFAIVRGLLPERRSMALLAACFLVAWSPSDMARLSTVDGAVYQGITMHTLLAVALFLEAWRRRSFCLLGAAVATAFAAIRCYEGVLALLAAAPGLLLLREPRSRRLWGWSLAWEAGIALALVSFLLEVWVAPKQSAYQFSYLDMHPATSNWLARMAGQYVLHLAPLLTSPPRELLTSATPLALAAFLLALRLGAPGAGQEPDERRLLLALGATGIAVAGLGYGVILLGVTATSAFRLQFLSGPGIAVVLAAAVGLARSLLPERARLLAVLVAGGWVIAVGTGRTVSMEHELQPMNFYSRQMHALSELVRLVPDVVPHTLIIMLDDSAWNTAFGFHHAVQYLYERRAAGYVPRRDDKLYLASAEAGGIRFEPTPVIRWPWDQPRAVFRFDEIVVLRTTRRGDVTFLDAWPEELLPLPAGARYAPRARLGSGPLPRARILSATPPPR